jgi:hypothetical protein
MILYSQKLRGETNLEGTHVDKAVYCIVKVQSAASSAGFIRVRIGTNGGLF